VAFQGRDFLLRHFTFLVSKAEKEGAMAIAAEVARVSGAVRCTPRGRTLCDYRSVTRKTSQFTISELLADTEAYARRELERISKALRSTHKRHS
jgi:hypothetical protein